MTQQSTVLLYKIIFLSSFVSFSSTSALPVLLLCSVSANLFASLLPYPAELCWFPWNQEIKPSTEDFLLLGTCIACAYHTKLFWLPSSRRTWFNLLTTVSASLGHSVYSCFLFSGLAFISSYSTSASSLDIHLLVSPPTYTEKADEVSTPFSKQKK